MTDTSSGPSLIQGQWKSRFPVARIKKIMQADEDVGKVAQVTPVAISKALEIFMDRIIKAVADETKSRGARRVTPSHFKQIISTQKQYDFLESLTSEIALPPSRPPTPPPGARRRRKQSPTMSGVVSFDAPKRKRRSPMKDKARSAPSASPDFKSEMEDVKMENAEPESADLNHAEQTEHTEERRRGWFDIVMGSNEHDSSEDETVNKRRKAVKDEDDDYMD